MARAVADIARDIRALSLDDKSELLFALMAELDAPSSRELELLVKELAESVERTNQALGSAVARLEGLDGEIERGAAEVRERALRAGEAWPLRI
jgi:hypothetical protein